MRRLLMVIAAFWCGFASLNAQAQSADTLRLNATYDNGVWQSSDTTLPYNAKVVVPQTVTLSGGSSGTYSLRLRYKAGIDTLALNYEVSGNTEGERIGILSSANSADTLYTNYLSFAIMQTPSQSGATQASISIGYWPSPLAENEPCATATTDCERVCNGGFSTMSTGAGINMPTVPTFGGNTCYFGSGQTGHNNAQSWFGSSRTPDHFYGSCTPTIPTIPATFPQNFSVPRNNLGRRFSADRDSTYMGIAITTATSSDGIPYSWVERIQQTVRPEPLLNGRSYVASFQTSLAQNSTFASSLLTMRVENGGRVYNVRPPQNRVITVGTTQNTLVRDHAVVDTSGWYTVSGVIPMPNTGVGTETTITIGAIDTTNLNLGRVNFRTDNSVGTFAGAYYYIDDVHLTLVPDTADREFTIACGGSITLGDSACGRANMPRNMSVVWRIGGANGTVIANANALTYNATATTVYTRIVTISGISFTSQYTVNVTPPATIAISGNTAVCSGANTLTATITPANAAPANAILWTLNGTQVGTGFTYTPTVSGTYIVQTLGLACNSSDTIVVTLVPDAIASIKGVPLVVCASTDGTNNNAISVTGGFVNTEGKNQWQYTWSVVVFGTNQVATGVTIADATAPNTTINFPAGGRYTIRITAVNGSCTRTFDKEIAIVGNCCVRNSAGAAVPPSQLTILGNPYKTTVYTPANFPGNNITALNYFVVGDIIIDNPSAYSSININSSTFYMKGRATGGGANTFAQGTVQGPYISMAGFYFQGRAVTFRAACDTMWGGLRVNSDPKGTTFHLKNNAANTVKSLVQDSYDGVIFKKITPGSTPGPEPQPASSVNPPVFYLYQAQFINNYKSIQLDNIDSEYGTQAAWQNIVSCNFDCDADKMKKPLQATTFSKAPRKFQTFAHITLIGSSGLGWSSTTATQRFKSNTIANALYGIFAPNHGGTIYSEGNSFKYNQIAGIYHSSGDLRLYNANAILLPDSIITSIAMQLGNERAVRNLATEGGLNAPSFGIYATDGCNDLVAQQTSIRSHKNQPTVAAPDSLPFNHIGYFGRGVNVTFSENSAKGNFINGVWFMKHGIQLIGAGDYSIRATGFINNKKAIVFGTDEGSPATLLGKDKFGNGTNLLSIRCNEFVRQQSGTSPVTHNIRNVQCIGISVEGAINIEEIGTLQNPNGNEVRTSLNLCTAFNQNGQCTQAPTSTLLDFFRASNLIPEDITYHCYNQENIDYYQDYSLTVHRGNKNATDTTCFASMGILNRMGNNNVGTTSTKVFLDSRLVLLEQNYPNPALHGSTEIKYSFPSNAEGMNLVVYDLRSGRKMAEQPLMQAEGIVSLDTKGWATGIYSYCLVQQGRVITAKKMAVGQ